MRKEALRLIEWIGSKDIELCKRNCLLLSFLSCRKQGGRHEPYNTGKEKEI